MAITRRLFLAGSAALAGVAMTRIGLAESNGFLALRAGKFRAGMACDVEWLEFCASSSLWHFDNWSFAGHSLICHGPTRLAFLITKEETGITAQQIAHACWPGNEADDPDRVVAHAARYVAEHATSLLPPTRMHDRSPVFIRYHAFEDEPFEDPIIVSAPPILPALLTKDEAEAWQQAEQGRVGYDSAN